MVAHKADLAHPLERLIHMPMLDILLQVLNQTAVGVQAVDQTVIVTTVKQQQSALQAAAKGFSIHSHPVVVHPFHHSTSN